MFTITADTAAVEKRIDAITASVEALHEEVPKQFLDWQAEDMHRKRPYAQVQQADSKDTTVIVATTRIWPRGRSVHKGKGGQQLDRRRGRRHRIHHRHRAHTSTRPILRGELYDKLVERIRALIQTVMARS
jgi:hypothetical protein